MELKAQAAMTVGDWAGVAGVLVGVIALVYAIRQLRTGAAATRAQATIQFQEAFRGSSRSRNYLMKSFPVHEDVLPTLADPALAAKFRTWRTLGDLTKEDKECAAAVVRAMNDVAQYVADGLTLRSALQQYHTIFVRTGVLLGPYLDQRNARREGRSQARWGRRVMDLYNAGIDYHRLHPKHRERELVLERPAVDENGAVVDEDVKVRLVLLDLEGKGVRKHPGFEDEASRTWSDELEMKRAVKEAERKIRR